VNMAWVGQVEPELGGRLVVRLKDAARTELIVVRERRRAFKERLVL
jgi:phage gp37-like protein